MPPSLVAKIESGQFVEMGDLVPSHLGFGDTASNKSKQRSVANISEWLEAFAVYVSVISRNGVSRAPAAGGGLPMLQLRHYIT